LKIDMREGPVRGGEVYPACEGGGTAPRRRCARRQAIESPAAEPRTAVREIEIQQPSRLDWIDDRDERFAAHQLSDGTLRAVALIAALAQPAERLPPVVVVDEPELGLHPSAVGLIAAVARSVSRHTQVVFATQSTAFLDQFEPEEIVIAERIEGATRLTRPDPVVLRDWARGRLPLGGL
jgi:predicted ATPase